MFLEKRRRCTLMSGTQPADQCIVKLEDAVATPAEVVGSAAAGRPPGAGACIIACMVALQIREVPEELRDRLSELARQRGQSLQAYLFDVLSDEARRQDNLAVLDRFSKGTYGTRLSPADILGALDAGRAERDTELGARETER